MQKSCIQIFAKAPIEGYCKTRLAKDIGNEEAASLHSTMIEETVSKLCDHQPENEIQLWCKPDTSHIIFQKMAKQYDISLFEQHGRILGEILDNAAQQILMPDYQTVQVGTDCPELDLDYVTCALGKLKHHDIVIGPAADGGYTLLAQKKHHPGLYQGIEWGGTTVLEQLIRNLEFMGLSYKLLKTLSDIDTIEDLNNFNLSVI